MTRFRSPVFICIFILFGFDLVQSQSPCPPPEPGPSIYKSINYHDLAHSSNSFWLPSCVPADCDTQYDVHVVVSGCFDDNNQPPENWKIRLFDQNNGSSQDQSFTGASCESACAPTATYYIFQGIPAGTYVCVIFNDEGHNTTYGPCESAGFIDIATVRTCNQ